MVKTRNMRFMEKTNQKKLKQKTIMKPENSSVQELLKLCREVTVRLSRCNRIADQRIENVKGKNCNFLEKL